MKLQAAFGVLCVVATIMPAAAQQQSVRVRGTVEQADGPVLTVKSRDGDTLKLKMADDLKVTAMVKASLSDIKPGSFVGATAMPEENGRWRAVEVHIFPESMRGVPESDHPNDYRPKSTMTNGTVNNVANGSGTATVTKEEGTTLTLKYNESEKIIDVPLSAVIYTYAPGAKDELKPGAIINSAATKQADGSLMTARINVARGIVPPM
jgi:hypothetical protein